MARKEKKIVCKKCREVFPKGTKVCPKCGAKVKKNKFFVFLGVVGIIVALIWMINDGKEGSSKSSNSEVSYNVGQTFNTKQFEVTVTKVNKVSYVGDGFFWNETPSDGAIYVTVEYTYKNITDKPISAFSDISVRLVDSKGTKYSSDVGASGAFASTKDFSDKLLSDINPGITIKSGTVFEVAESEFDKDGWYLDVDRVKVKF